MKNVLHIQCMLVIKVTISNTSIYIIMCERIGKTSESISSYSFKENRVKKKEKRRGLYD